jgi:hypothetical protein
VEQRKIFPKLVTKKIGLNGVILNDQDLHPVGIRRSVEIYFQIRPQNSVVAYPVPVPVWFHPESWLRLTFLTEHGSYQNWKGVQILYLLSEISSWVKYLINQCNLIRGVKKGLDHGYGSATLSQRCGRYRYGRYYYQSAYLSESCLIGTASENEWSFKRKRKRKRIRYISGEKNTGSTCTCS